MYRMKEALSRLELMDYDSSWLLIVVISYLSLRFINVFGENFCIITIRLIQFHIIYNFININIHVSHVVISRAVRDIDAIGYCLST